MAAGLGSHPPDTVRAPDGRRLHCNKRTAITKGSLMTTLIRQRSRGFWAALAVGIVTGALMNGMFRPQFSLADADTTNGDKFAQLTT